MIKPLGNFLLIKPIKEEEDQNQTGIVIPKTHDTMKHAKGTIIDISEEITTESPIVGDTVIYYKHAFEEVEDNNQKYRLVKKTDLIAVVE